MSLADTKTAPNTQPKKIPSRPDKQLLMGNLNNFFKDDVNFFLETGKINPVMDMRMAHMPNLLVTDADLAKEILQTKNRQYLKEKRLMGILEEGADKVMFTTDGEEWMWRRRLMQPAFHKKQVAQFIDAILAESEKTVAEWHDGEQVDMNEAMKVLTMMIIGKTMFNVDMENDSAELHDAYRRLNEILIAKIQSVVQVPSWLPTKLNRDAKEVNDTIRSALTTIMDDRKKSQEPHNDLLDMLLTMVDVENGFTQNQMIYEMSSIVFAGHETTAATLSWALYRLTQHPEVAEKLYTEIDTVLEGRTPTMEELGKLPYLDMVINETLRLHPAARATTRRAVEDDMIGGYKIKAETNIFINIQGIHMDERYWDDPLAFEPERFSPERSKERNRWAFLPFLDGPRKCIGEPLSRAEMQLILVTLIQNFRFRLPEGFVVEPEAGFVLQPKALELIVEKRD